jgi:hypothetical protein
MNRLWLLYRPKIILTLLIFSLLGWAITSTIIAVLKKPERLFVRISKDQISIDDKTTSDDDRILEINFLRNFVMFVYNFDELNYLKNLNRGSYLMSDQFWTKTSEEIPKVSQAIRDQKIQQTAVIEKMTKIDGDTYDLFTVNQYQRAHEIETRNYKIRVKIQTVQRTKENPWGMEVTNADQERIN